MSLPQVYFIDFEGVRTNTSMIIKELSILEYTSKKISTFYVFPPISERHLNENAIKINEYLKHFRHGFSYTSGLVQYKRLKFIFEVFFRVAKASRNLFHIYVKGDEKCDVIKHLLSNFESVISIINLESLNCPKYELSAEFSKCLFYGKNKAHKYCSEAKIKFYCDWFSKQNEESTNKSEGIKGKLRY